ncbi:TPA: VacJ family lipoprotein, partial [Pseudomonas aeruginosa]|nr:VacJ family lipoprotein [Pseudomonas aeruginosa]
TLRDAPAKIPDIYVSPYHYMDDVRARNVMFGINTVDTRANLLKSEKLISGDKYIFIRNAYLQNREFKVKDGEVEDDF